MKKGPEHLSGFLDHGVTVKGELHFVEMLRIDARVEGKVISDHHLVVGETADVDAEIEVGRATLGGSVKGIVRAKERIDIVKGARVYAELFTPILTIEEGAFFEGKCNMSATAKSELRNALSVVGGKA